ncbi:FAD-dependent oxidoreductase [Mycolicibacterium neoaurum]|uniref:FAD-dependent oxidoreductase n=1 Tax=Mycolicibacterium neoaurum TaxID=1795 RepID=UPI002670EF9D|nr:FAD-dependent oxidoreductase [Mycolicibacterium neoaurum]MDO3402735.1 FAD-dependent oxidoreductase [Mycolicibacterium neoaurum]
MTDFDVIVVGSGAAGLCAAVTARESGAESVAVVDSETVVGGSSRLSGGVIMGSGSQLQRNAGIDDDPDDLVHEYLSLNGWDVARAPVSRWAKRTGKTIDWLAAHDVPFFERLIFGGDERAARSHCVDGGGEALVKALYSAALGAGVEFAMGRRVERLVQDGSGTVIGVESGGEILTAASVVVATGGFGANDELLAAHFPSAYVPGWSWYIGADSSRGDHFALADGVGAQITGRDRGLRTLDPGLAKLNEAFLPGWAVLVDGTGARMIDETAPYGLMDQVMRAHGDRAWVIFDDAALRPPAELADQYRHSYKQVWPNHPPFRTKNYNADIIDHHQETGGTKVLRGQSLAELAAELPLPPGRLAGEIGRYNDFASRGVDDDYGKAAKFLLPVTTAPFYAIEVRALTVNLTACGLRIDGQARVIGADGRPIPGLHAAGECTGGIIKTYIGSGNSLANACGFGRIAGEEAARRALAANTPRKAMA